MRRLLRTGIPLVLSVSLTVLWQIHTAGAGAVLRAAAEQEAPVIRAGVDLVRVDVIVTGKGDAVVDDLTADDFEVVENGRRQTVSVFTGGPGERSPDLHLGILLDVSGSMALHAQLENARYNAIELVNRLTEAVDYTLVVVNGCVRVSRFTRRDVGRLIDRIRDVSQLEHEEVDRKREGQPLSCYNGTVLWDGFVSYLSGIQGQAGRHVLVAFTDGNEGESTATFDHVRTAIRSSTATVFGVLSWWTLQAPSRMQYGIPFQQIVDETSGITVFPYRQKQVDEVHQRIVRDVRSQYTLGFVSTDERRDGRWREVTIRLARPEHKDLSIRARDGYYAAKAAALPR